MYKAHIPSNVACSPKQEKEELQQRVFRGGTQNKDAESYCSHSNWKLAGAFCTFPLGIPSPTIFSAVTEGALKGNGVVFFLFPHYLLCCRY